MSEIMVRIPKPNHDALKRLAHRRETSMNKCIVETLNRELAAEGLLPVETEEARQGNGTAEAAK